MGFIKVPLITELPFLIRQKIGRLVLWEDLTTFKLHFAETQAPHILPITTYTLTITVSATLHRTGCFALNTHHWLLCFPLYCPGYCSFHFTALAVTSSASPLWLLQFPLHHSGYCSFRCTALDIAVSAAPPWILQFPLHRPGCLSLGNHHCFSIHTLLYFHSKIGIMTLYMS